MYVNKGIFKINETTFVGTDWLEEKIRNKNFSLDWCSVSSFEIDLMISKQSFYSLDVCKPLVSYEKIKTFFNKVFSPFLYYLISEHQKNRSESVFFRRDGSGNAISYSFLFLLIF